jgi:5-methylcytosine-specific restriction protein A
MNKADLERLERTLSEGVGLPIRATSRPSNAGEVIKLVPREMEEQESFSVEVSLSWLSARSSAKPGAFAGDFVRTMGQADSASREAFCLIAKSLTERRLGIELQINGLAADPSASGNWPTDWTSFVVSVAGRPNPPSENDNARFSEIRLVSHATLSLISSLAAEAADETALPSAEEVALGYPEGAVTRVVVNRYERDRRNRGLCIAVHGYSCQACGFDFESTYGSLGSGFIHVHHIVSIARMGPDYRINPVNDLAPLCPNCHAMVHKHAPPLSISELKKVLIRRPVAT